MPKFLEAKLRAEAGKRGFKGNEADHYVYGALNNMGAMHGSKETPKGAAMDRKHAADMKPRRRLHPALMERAKLVKAAHEHLSANIPGFKHRPMRERMAAAQAHIRSTQGRRVSDSRL